MRPPRRGLPLVLAALLVCGAVRAQYFGRNKVQWEDFDFQVLHTEHFDIHHYLGDAPAVTDAGRMVERWYDRLAPVFRHEFDERKPIVLYANHPDFQQTTVASGLIGEGTGGFTESLRSRIVLPLTESYGQTDHVLGHELVHAFQFDLAAAHATGVGGAVPQLPLWMVEGLAEYLSQGRTDVQTSMWLRDALIHDYLPTPQRLERDPRLSPYQFGQAFWAWIGGHWDDGTVIDLYLAAQREDLDTAFARVLGQSPKEVFDAWHREIRRHYAPVLEARQELPAGARRLLARENTRSALNIAPVLSPDGSRVAFLSTRDLFTVDLFLADARSGKVLRKLVSASADPHFAALRFIDTAGTWSPDGSEFAFVAISRGDDALVIADGRRGAVRKRLRPKGVETITNPAWSPDGRRLAFSGSSRGFTDLYVLDLDSGSLDRLTEDAWADLQPSWSSDGRTLAFASDRGAGPAGLEQLDHRPLRLCLFDLAERRIRQLPGLAGGQHTNPQFGPAGELYFIASTEGIADVFRYDLSRGAVSRVTAVATGVTGITDLSPALSVAAQTGEVTFSTLEDGAWSIWALSAEQASRGLPEIETGIVAAAVLPPQPQGIEQPLAYFERNEPAPDLERSETTDYKPRLRLEFVGPVGVGASSDVSGISAGASTSLYFGDMLNRHRVALAVAGGVSSELDIGQSIAAQTFYLNQAHRLQWGGSISRIPYLSGFSFARTVPVEVDGETVAGTEIGRVIEVVTRNEVGAIARYPLSLEHRLEASAGVAGIEYDSELESTVYVGDRAVGDGPGELIGRDPLDLYWTSLAWVGDKAFFGFVSPARGSRYRLELTATSGDLGYQTGLADFRRYAFARPVTFAFRALHLGRYGTDAEDPRLSELFVGNYNLVRGYDPGSFEASECTVVAGSTGCPEFDRLFGSRIGVLNFELRLPLAGTEEFGVFETKVLPIELALFADGGGAWTSAESLELDFERETIARVPVFSAGVALRTVLGFVPLQLFYAVPLQRPEDNGSFGFAILPGW